MEQRKRLQQVILDRIHARKAPRGFRRYCRLARFVSDQELEREVADLAEPSGSILARHAQWVLHRSGQVENSSECSLISKDLVEHPCRRGASPAGPLDDIGCWDWKRKIYLLNKIGTTQRYSIDYLLVWNHVPWLCLLHT